MSKHSTSTAEIESLGQLRGDCAHMKYGHGRRHGGPAEREAGSGELRSGGVHVPERSSRLLEGMSDYGN